MATSIQDIRFFIQKYGFKLQELEEITGIPADAIRKQLEAAGSWDGQYMGDACADLVCEEALAYGSDKSRRYTVADYYKIPEERRVELIDGVIYDLGSPGPIHQTVLTELVLQIAPCVKRHGENCRLFFAPMDVQLNRDTFTMVQPDLLIICSDDILRSRCIYGAPDFIAEIVSPSNRRHDTVRKLAKYRSAGVREYWVIDPYEKRILVYLFGEEEKVTIFPMDAVVPVTISKGACKVDFGTIRREIEPLYDLPPIIEPDDQL
ncbi:MAG: Uma2 family endonuclease [Eubacterium sp.]|nr:Uma2 family endonuclease [Eubacterium sp.]